MSTAIIGGTGLYALPGFEIVGEVEIDTPFGAPSDVIVHGRLGAIEAYFLPRHGRGHRLLPSEINHRANVWALKALGVDAVLGISAVGALRPDLRARDVLVPDQIVDRGKAGVAHTFFGEGVVAHVAFAEPFCPVLRAAVVAAARAAADAEGADRTVLDGGTYIQIEGPAFSTAAESRLYRSWGCDVVGMTLLGEAKLCREAEICYAVAAMITDCDAGVDGQKAVTAEMVLANLRANAAFAPDLVARFLAAFPTSRACACRDALAAATLTPWDAAPAAALRRLEPIVRKYAERRGSE